MSYRWTQQTIPITSLIALEKAIERCNFQTIKTPPLFKELKKLRENISKIQNKKDKIVAYTELIELIKKCGNIDSLPSSIQFETFTLKFNNFRYIISREERTSDRRSINENIVKSEISKLNKAYKEVIRELAQEIKDTKAEYAQTLEEIDIELRQALIRTVRAEQESYRNSVESAKEKIFKTIQKNAIKKGYSIKRNKFKTGKHAGREQYVVVKRR